MKIQAKILNSEIKLEHLSEYLDCWINAKAHEIINPNIQIYLREGSRYFERVVTMDFEKWIKINESNM